MIYYKLEKTSKPNKIGGWYRFRYKVDGTDVSMKIQKLASHCYQGSFADWEANGGELFVTREWLKLPLSTNGVTQDAWEQIVVPQRYASRVSAHEKGSNTDHSLKFDAKGLRIRVVATGNTKRDGKAVEVRFTCSYPDTTYIEAYEFLSVSGGLLTIKPGTRNHDEMTLSTGFSTRMGIHAKVQVSRVEVPLPITVQVVKGDSVVRSIKFPSDGVLSTSSTGYAKAGKPWAALDPANELTHITVSDTRLKRDPATFAELAAGTKVHAEPYFKPMRVVRTKWTDATPKKLVEFDVRTSNGDKTVEIGKKSVHDMVAADNPYRFGAPPAAPRAGQLLIDVGWFLMPAGGLIEGGLWPLAADDPKSPASLG